MVTRAVVLDVFNQSPLLYAEWSGILAGDDGAPFTASGWQLLSVFWRGTEGTTPSLQVQVAHDTPMASFATLVALNAVALGPVFPTTNLYPLFGRAFRPLCSTGVGTSAICNMIFRRA